MRQDQPESAVFGRSGIIVFMSKQFHLDPSNVHAEFPAEYFDEGLVQQTIKELCILARQINDLILAGDSKMNMDSLRVSRTESGS